MSGIFLLIVSLVNTSCWRILNIASSLESLFLEKPIGMEVDPYGFPRASLGVETSSPTNILFLLLVLMLLMVLYLKKIYTKGWLNLESIKENGWPEQAS